MKWRSISSVTSKSAITPSFRGLIAWIVPGVRPSIRFASIPTAWTSPERESTATTLGSDNTIPRPRTYTSVFAVPRSTAMSRPPEDVQVVALDRRDRRRPTPLDRIAAGPSPPLLVPDVPLEQRLVERPELDGGRRAIRAEEPRLDHADAAGHRMAPAREGAKG